MLTLFVPLPRIASRADREDLALAKYWRDCGASEAAGITLADARRHMRNHARAWALRRRRRENVHPYAEAA